MDGAVSDPKAKKTRKPKAELESRTFKDGAIYLFRRADYKKPTWFCRVKVPNAKGYVSYSTKTTDEHAAYAFANDLFNKTMVRVASGQDLKSKKVVAAIKEYREGLEALPKLSSTAKTRIQFLSYTTSFFANTRLKEVDTATLASLNDWIQQNSRRKALSPNTVKRYTTDLKQFFTWCVERGFLERLPTFPKVKAEAIRRPHFDDKDWSKLARHLQEFVKTPSPKVARDRKLLRDYVLILKYTGIRVGEARNLKWRDIREIQKPKGSEEPADIALYVKGKTGAREVVASSHYIRTYLKRLLEMRTLELGRKPANDEFVFCSQDGKPIGSFKKSFSSLLKSAGVEFDSHGAKRTIYSLRHTYATKRLQEGVHQFVLARNMGTSVAMLERHYGHTSNVASAAELTKWGRFKGGSKSAAVDWLME